MYHRSGGRVGGCVAKDGASAHHELLEEAARRARGRDDVCKDVGGPLGRVEIDQHGAPAAVEQHVVRLDIAVQHAHLVQVRHG